MRLGVVLAAMERQFAEAGCESAARDARLLMAHACGLTHNALLDPERWLDEATCLRLTAFTARRVAREPVSRIIGTRGFWTLEVAISPATLDPRPDSETVVEAVLAALPVVDRPRRVLDLGTGSGCLLLALLSEWPLADGLGMDISPHAITVAEGNARRTGLAERAHFQVGSWLDPAVCQRLGASDWDVIVCNPPYLSVADMAALQPEVVYDPPTALLAGVDGLDDYRALAPLLYRWINPAGVVALEVGRDQAAEVAALLTAAGFTRVWTCKDLAGIERVVMTKP